MATTGQGDAHITARDLEHVRDARSGLATASFSQNPADSTNAGVLITFADGATWRGGLYDMDAFSPQGPLAFFRGDQGPNEWRIAIGSDWQ